MLIDPLFCFGGGKGIRTPDPSDQSECSPLINASISALLFHDLISSSRIQACDLEWNCSEYTTFHGRPDLVDFDRPPLCL